MMRPVILRFHRHLSPNGNCHTKYNQCFEPRCFQAQKPVCCKPSFRIFLFSRRHHGGTSHHEQKRNSELAHPSLPIDLSCFPHHPFLLAFTNPGLKGYSFCIMRHQIHTGTIACALKPGGGAHGWTTTPRYCLPRSSFSLQVRLWEEAVFSDSKHSCIWMSANCQWNSKAAIFKNLAEANQSSGVKKIWRLERRNASLSGRFAALRSRPYPTHQPHLEMVVSTAPGWGVVVQMFVCLLACLVLCLVFPDSLSVNLALIGMIRTSFNHYDSLLPVLGHGMRLRPSIYCFWYGSYTSMGFNALSELAFNHAWRLVRQG